MWLAPDALTAPSVLMSASLLCRYYKSYNSSSNGRILTTSVPRSCSVPRATSCAGTARSGPSWRSARSAAWCWRGGCPGTARWRSSPGKPFRGRRRRAGGCGPHGAGRAQAQARGRGRGHGLAATGGDTDSRLRDHSESPRTKVEACCGGQKPELVPSWRSSVAIVMRNGDRQDTRDDGIVIRVSHNFPQKLNSKSIFIQLFVIYFVSD